MLGRGVLPGRVCCRVRAEGVRREADASGRLPAGQGRDREDLLASPREPADGGETGRRIRRGRKAGSESGGELADRQRRVVGADEVLPGDGAGRPGLARRDYRSHVGSVDVDKAVLVTTGIRAGQQLLEELVKGGFDVSAAAWLRSTDLDQWCLHVTSKDARTR